MSKNSWEVSCAIERFVASPVSKLQDLQVLTPSNHSLEISWTPSTQQDPRMFRSVVMGVTKPQEATEKQSLCCPKTSPNHAMMVWRCIDMDWYCIILYINTNSKCFKMSFLDPSCSYSFSGQLHLSVLCGGDPSYEWRLVAGRGLWCPSSSDPWLPLGKCVYYMHMYIITYYNTKRYKPYIRKVHMGPGNTY